MKQLSRAKARLAPALNEADRRDLAFALFRDVLAAALSSPALDAVAVVSEDADVLSYTTDAGAEPLAEPGGLNSALTAASRTLAKRGADRLLVLAADLPLAATADIEAAAQADADIAIVPSRDGGTNALSLSPGAIPFRFGVESARQHERAAQAEGLRALRLDLPSLVLDVDTPADLDELRHAAESGRTVGASTLELLLRLGLVAESVPER